jgi:protein SCO1/2
MVLTPDGRVSRYLYGTSTRPLDLRLALVEASQGKVGGIVDRVIMTCYRYDPAARAYGLYVVGFVRLGGVLILVVVVATVGLLFRREKRAGRRGRTS